MRICTPSLIVQKFMGITSTVYVNMLVVYNTLKYLSWLETQLSLLPSVTEELNREYEVNLQ